MGLRSSKQGQLKVAEVSSFHHHLINYLTKNHIRTLVSKKRRRLLLDGYDLDMSYITDRVLAMSFPAERMRAMYRNPLWQVKSVLDMKHYGHYKSQPASNSLFALAIAPCLACSTVSLDIVYNLCIEENYDASLFHGRVENFPFDDNHVPPLPMIKLFCESVHAWLASDPQNIAVIHCMAGKGRTGLMVCAYLVYLGMSAEEALQLYAQQRTTNNEGVSIPSQRRYVGYWAGSLSSSERSGTGPPTVNLQACSRELRRIRLYDTINIDSVFFVVSELQTVPGQMYSPPVEVAKGCCRQTKKGHQRTNSPRYYLSFVESDEGKEDTGKEEPHVVVQMDTESTALYQKTCLDYYFEKPLQVTGDLRVIFYQKMIGGRLFYACFNTAFIKNSLLQFSVRDMDKIGTKGRSICGPVFSLELLFGPANAKYPLETSFDDDDDDDNF
ncbi:Tensin phosphatase, C2 domain [Dillenia turbinata]|uniref:Tensin phosphatase, C2 domain n=1 Tax=Dillenia turbinata TaxID=194707 RepID=A0AAN8UDD4_9MAGN